MNIICAKFTYMEIHIKLGQVQSCSKPKSEIVKIYMFINLHIGRAYITLQYKYYTQHNITIMIQTEKYTDLC